MIERGTGQIVNVSSGAGSWPTPFMLAYSATKFAVFGLSEGLRMELRPHGIGVTTLCPGFIDTPIIGTSVMRGEHAAERGRSASSCTSVAAMAPRRSRCRSSRRRSATMPSRAVTTESARLTLCDVAVAPPARAGWPRGSPPPSTDRIGRPRRPLQLSRR